MADVAPTPALSRVEMTHIVLPQFANAMGHVFGGQLVSWMDICAAVAAQRHARRHVVTASIDAVHFMVPIRQGHTVVLKGQVNAAFSSSMECGVSVWTEDVLTGDLQRAAKAYLTFVALGDDDRPTSVRELALETDDDRRRARDAVERREQRLKMRQVVESRRG